MIEDWNEIAIGDWVHLKSLDVALVRVYNTDVNEFLLINPLTGDTWSGSVSPNTEHSMRANCTRIENVKCAITGDLIYTSTKKLSFQN